MRLPALPAEAKHDFPAGDIHVPVAHRGEAEGTVIARVFVVPHPNQRRLQECDNRGEDAVPGEPRRRKVAPHPRPDLRERGPERDHALVLGLVADLSPPCVVAVLLPPAGVTAGGLNVTVRIGTDPDVLPRRRDDDRANALEGRAIPDRAAPRVEIEKSPTRASAFDAGRSIGHVAK